MSDNKPQKPAAFIFGKRPETVTAPVKFTSVTGAEVDIECTFKYRTRKEFAQLWDEISSPSGAVNPEKEDFSYERMVSSGMDGDAKNTLKYLASWPLDLELNSENLVRLFDEESAVARHFWEAYRNATLHGRLGN